MTSGDAYCTPASGGGFSGLCGYLSDLSFYTPDKVRFVNSAFTPPSEIPDPPLDEIVSISYIVCDGNTPTTTDATPMSVAVVYSVETTSGRARQCSEAGITSLGG